MNYVFAKSSKGYSHIDSHKPCQDFSSSYQDNERFIITCCDGHGGKQYIRSEIGSRLASEAIMNVFKSIDKKMILKTKKEELQEKIKLLILVEYNKLVERDISSNPFKRSDFKDLNEDEIDNIKFNYAKAYGTTLSGAMLYRNNFIIISIGDTEVFGISKGKLVKLFDNSNDPAGNVTYSMCQEDAYKYLRVTIIEKKSVDGIILCTDGLASPYQNYDNLFTSFINPTVRKIIITKSVNHVDEHVDKLAYKLGMGDDVSLSFIILDNINIRNYR